MIASMPGCTGKRSEVNVERLNYPLARKMRSVRPTRQLCCTGIVTRRDNQLRTITFTTRLLLAV